MSLYVEKQFIVHRIFSPDFCLEERLNPQKIFWLSRHPLLEEQKAALFYLHGKNVEIWHLPDVVFHSKEEFVQCLNYRYADGFVYAVAPLDFFTFAMEKGCSFGNFHMKWDDDGVAHLLRIYHYTDCHRSTVIDKAELESLLRMEDRRGSISLKFNN